MKAVFSALILLASTVLPNSAAVAAAELPGIDIYGQAHVSFDNLFYGNANPGVDDVSQVLHSHNSYLGLRASRDFSERLGLYANAEGRVSGDKGDYDYSHVAYVGLRTNWGRLQFGSQDGPAYLLSHKVDLFSERTGAYTEITRGLSALNDRFHDRPARETVAYISPEFLGHVSVHVAGSADQDSTGNTNEPLALGLSYDYEGLVVGVTHTHLREGPDNAAAQTTRFALRYPAGAWTLVAMADRTDDEQTVTHASYLLGGQYAFGKHLVKAQVSYVDDVDGFDHAAKVFQLGWDFVLDERATLYVMASQAQVDANASLRFGELNYDGDKAVSLGVIFGF